MANSTPNRDDITQLDELEARLLLEAAKSCLSGYPGSYSVQNLESDARSMAQSVRTHSESTYHAAASKAAPTLERF